MSAVNFFIGISRQPRLADALKETTNSFDRPEVSPDFVGILSDARQRLPRRLLSSRAGETLVVDEEIMLLEHHLRWMSIESRTSAMQ